MGTALQATAANAATNTPPLVRDGPVGQSYDLYTGKTVTTAFDIFNPGAALGAEFGRQWHLSRLGDIASVWQDYTGRGVSVGIYDSGVEKDHWDLAANYDASKELVIDGVAINGGLGASMEGHGTSVAGLIAGAANGRGGVGVAFDAKVTGVNIFDSASPVDVNGSNYGAFMEAMNQANRFDVVNHSWGDNNTAITTRMSRSTEGTFYYDLAKSFAYIAATGRDGLGTISVSAAGNEGVDRESQGSKTDRHNIAVSAYREADGVSSYYTSYGAHILVAGPSSDYTVLGGSGLVTTDIRGQAGYNMEIDSGAAADYTDQFGGTSGATPIVTGVVSLMLDANAGLGWRDVKDILAASAKMPLAFDTGPTGYRMSAGGGTLLYAMNETATQLNGQSAGWNGGAMHFNNSYGYGAVDAYGAARMAEVWSLFGPAKTSANEVTATTGVLPIGMTANTDIEFVATNTIGFNSDIVGEPQRFTFEFGTSIDADHIDLTITGSTLVKFLWAGEEQLRATGMPQFAQFKLIAPDGTVGFTAQMGNLLDGSGPAQEFVYGFSGFRGVETKGTWTLEFQSLDLDLKAVFGESSEGYTDNTLTIDSLKMDVFGSAPSADDVYTYTNEFFTMKAIEGEGAKRALLSDTNGGVDWINAAAVTASVNVSLVAGVTNTIGGKDAFTIASRSKIENVVTGDGNDNVTGNSLANELHGMRGNDMLFGAAGADKLDGGAGRDWLDGGTGADILTGGAGADIFFFDNARTSGVDRITDFASDDLLYTTRAIRDSNRDGYIGLGTNKLLNLDTGNSGDRVAIDGLDATKGLVYMGMQDGYYVYAMNDGTHMPAAYA
ncbi:hypothetical protein ASE90_10865 [Sphingomonas sp. Leaf67]|uniref:S8 family serine peptidase n=1 Tax=Sphingomonas sp. Leaf67 TaxID=1736230 RepID=UPI0006FDFC44|nr:S8 family serine peptidase [Sphingomonas sp. Leaf67]KQN82183.1 hypothetical protein ASE90_10865 [Sphingomonas sp. Leaf67]